jgi:hypothetical protein
MQCVNCDFENMPGTPTCVRCGASLAISAAAISVNPPRARPWMKLLRRWLPVRRAYFAARDDLYAYWIRWALAEITRPVEVADMTPGFALRCAIPGWGHWFVGNRLRGALFAVVYWPTFLFALVAFGSTEGAVALGLTFAVHGATVVDLRAAGDDAYLHRFVKLPVAVGLALVVLYGVVFGVAGTFVGARQLVRTVAPFEPGDVVVYLPRAYVWRDPQPGDVVLYRVPEPASQQAFAFQTAGPTQYLVIAGERIDRVIAGPNSTVQWDGREMLVSGRPTVLRPLNEYQLPEALSLTVPANHYAILLTTDLALAREGPLKAWQFVSVVPADHIVGRVVLRNYPLSRRSWIQ